MKKQYCIVEPENGGDFQSQWEACVQQITGLSLPGWAVFRMSIFVDAADDEEWCRYRAMVQQSLFSHFDGCCPAFSVIAQAPIRHHRVTVEVGYIQQQGVIDYKQVDGFPYVVISKDGYREVWASGLGGYPHSNETEASAISAFEQMNRVLEAEQMTMNHVVRQWNYIARILERKQKEGGLSQCYQQFNEVRSQNYHQYRTIPGYPAATGIGTVAGGVVIDFCAVEEAEYIVTVDNPLQCAPYQYSQNILEGDVPLGKNAKQAPQFERAKLVAGDHYGALYVSGTAAIIGEHTIGLGKVDEQARATLAHIDELVDLGNKMFALVSEYPSGLETQLLRVYVKHQEHYEQVEAICRHQFGNVPMVFVMADVCRDNLLVEIEGEFSI